MATVMFYGDLREKFGTKFKLDVESAGEAVRALTNQIKGLRQHLQNGGYYIRVAKKSVEENAIKKDFKQCLNHNDVIHIVPEISGAGKFGQIIVGAALIVAAFYTGGASMGLWGTMSTGLFTAGVGMLLGGVTQMLMKPPKMDMNSQSAEMSKSSAFGNLGNRAAEGGCVPIIYGRVRVGSKVISQSLESYSIVKDIEENK
ncbi:MULTISPECIES: tail assembly protein [Pasteurellaceae]|uniref:Tail assembly protein n=1 Tax=Pasteurella atlantica TaxID=2827233 RepID=A0AAW8CHS6_9PAST|nr:tail assembly protein [Pasteurella atlantica]MBR0573677.1 tail assembly protein [Pasteurella atlantica]MDP8039690.1 tail assembly protein [Pasteurella atlantica]MDP8041781.1 tail assembly protein [Pasteurella atlantica]MDP8043945.1 tail assembly protein [Pasteurella atlantica]MDP8045923.1 tail assembly protein [Pasteurella atlantica]